MIPTEVLHVYLSPDSIRLLADDDRDGEADSTVVADALGAAELEVRRLANIASGDLPTELESTVAIIAVESLYLRRQQKPPDALRALAIERRADCRRRARAQVKRTDAPDPVVSSTTLKEF
ncbi:hypothetical protein GC173_13760 [bacterium]|nr:hypothetical protein [bacterium]